MPRRGRSSSPAAARRMPTSTLPARAAPQQAPLMQHAPQPQQPSLFKQMAATAGGVAVGSAVGHAVGAAMTGGVAHPAPSQESVAPAASATGKDPCVFEVQQFLNCAQQQDDLTLCQGFNEALRQCRTQYGVHP